jgi:uncharacterized BrkB/YihY/UPF0761 family membrane protein
MREFEKRTVLQQKKKRKRVSTALFSGVGALSVMLIVALSAVTDPTVPGQGESSYGSFLLSQEAGGYLIVALLGFVIGILLTFAILYRNGRLKRRRRD